MKKAIAVVVCCLFAGSLASYADNVAPFGILSAYNLVALGTSTVAGNIVGPTTSDSEGRIAAAGQITHTLNVADKLGSDPWGSLADGFALVAGGGVNVSPAGGHFTIKGGNVWASSNNANYYFNEPGTLNVGGTSSIDFAAERTAMQSLSSNLSTLTSNGTAVESGSSSWLTLTLSGTSTTLNVFTLTAAQFDNTNSTSLCRIRSRVQRSSSTCWGAA